MLKKVAKTIILLCAVNQLQAHDIKVASFTFSHESGKLFCEVKADRLQMLNAVNGDLCEQTLQYYLDDHFSILFDNKKLKQKVIEYRLTDHFMEITMSMETETINPNTIDVITTYLIDQVDGHENVVIFNRNDKARSFRLSSQRTKITANY